MQCWLGEGGLSVCVMFIVPFYLWSLVKIDLCGTTDKISILWLPQNYPVYVPVLYQSFKTDVLIQDEKMTADAKFGEKIVKPVWTVLWMYQLDLVGISVTT